MPNIRPISDLRSSANERQQALIDLYGKLAAAEQGLASGAEGEDFLTFSCQLRGAVHGAI